MGWRTAKWSAALAVLLVTCPAVSALAADDSSGGAKSSAAAAGAPEVAGGPAKADLVGAGKTSKSDAQKEQEQDAKGPPDVVRPIGVLVVGIVVVLGLIIGLKVNAFIALITAAMVVSLMAEGALADKITRVASAFGNTAGKIGIVIALAAVIGKCMLDSGAADRIVRAFLRLFGQRQAPAALLGSGFVLAVPVFFDTVFYLLVPLARSLHRKTGVHFLLYVLAIGAGGAITHTLVPPTPGPLAMANELGFDVGVMILVGLLVALPAAVVGLLYAILVDRWMPVPMRPIGNEPEPEALPDSELPPLALSLAPVVLPVLLISGNTVLSALAEGTAGDSWLTAAASISAVLGNANFALLISTVIAIFTLVMQRGLTRGELAHTVEVALMSGGVIILITAGGGAFGEMLKAAKVGPAIEYLFSGVGATGLLYLLLGFGVAAVLKIAQGSSTVAMITGAAMLGAMLENSDAAASLGFHPVYLATAIGAGSLVGSWMNDSGFWIFAKMSGLTEVEALKSWTTTLLVLAFASLAVTLLLAYVLPYPPFTVAPQGAAP